MTPPSRTISAARLTRRGCGLSGWTVKSCANDGHSKPRPDGHAALRQRGEIAQIFITLARSVKIRSGRCEEAVFFCALRPIAVLVRRVTARDHFDPHAAEVAKGAEQRGTLALLHFVAPRVRKDRQPARCDDPTDGVTEACPHVRNVTGFAHAKE